MSKLGANGFWYDYSRWTYSGIKRLFPKLPFTEWLGICKRGDHLHEDAGLVVSNVNWKNS
jgi:hypothetical protein